MRYILLLITGLFLARYNFFRPKRKGILVLLYHSLEEKNKGYKFSVSKKRFEWQLKLLKKRGFKSILPSELEEVIKNDLWKKERYVIITFDDGYANNLQAAELLKKHGMRAIFFISTAYIGKELKGRKMMDRGDIKKLIEMGMAIGSHSHTHKKAEEMPPSLLKADIETSLRILRNFYNIEDFAYPFGNYTKNAEEVLKNYGIKRAYIIGQKIYNPKKDSPFKIPRAIVREDSTKLDFHLIITRGRSKF